jgi:hypothetical protein
MDGRETVAPDANPAKVIPMGSPYPILTSKLMKAHRYDPSLAHCYDVMLDVDNIVLPILEVMASRAGGQRISYADCPTWDSLADLVDGGLEAMFTLFHECFDYEVMKEFSPFTGASAATNALADLGVRFHVKTARPVGFADGTRRYLDDHAIPYVSFRCASDVDKVAECLAEDIAIAVDDYPHFITTASAAGITVMTLAHPFTDDACQQTGSESAESWLELAEHVIAAVESALVRALQ